MSIDDISEYLYIQECAGELESRYFMLGGFRDHNRKGNVYCLNSFDLRDHGCLHLDKTKIVTDLIKDNGMHRITRYHACKMQKY